MRTWIRRLPRSNDPRPGETLSGYLLNLAYRLRLTPKDLIISTGLKDTAKPSLLDLRYMVALPDDARTNFTIATGLTNQEATNLTIQGRLGHALTSPDRTAVARTLHSNMWLNLGYTRYCPQCLATTQPATPDHAVWRLEWLTPWAIACTTHQRLLLDTCNHCHLPTGTSGPHTFPSAIPNIHRPVTHPAACRTYRANSPTGLCDSRLDQAQAPDADADLLDLQTHLNQVLADTPTATLTTLGIPVTPAEHLGDIRLATILLQLTPTPGTTEPVPLPEHVLTQPPTDTLNAARLLQRAVQLLDDPTNNNELHALSQHALKHHPHVWKKAIATGTASPALDHALKNPKNGILDPAKLRPYTTTSHFTFTAEHVPAYLDRDTYDLHFPDIPDRYQRPIRRCVPIALVRLVSNHDINTAGQLLGYDPSATQAACARASDAFDAIGLNDFRHRVARIATEHNTQPTHTNYAQLRTAFNADWTIPDDLWTQFQTALLDQKMARADTPWDRRRPAYNTWVWQLATQGDPNTAPMIRTTVNGRQCTNGVAKDISDLRRRTPAAHHQLVQDIAHQIKTRILATGVPSLARS